MTMAEEPGTPGTAPVSDHRPVPRGVLPRGFQTWLMAGLALGIVLIILITGQPEPPGIRRRRSRLLPLRTRIGCATIRNAFERWRRARHSKPKRAQPTVPATPRFEEPAGPAPEDPIAADRKRREYESLFASNVVLSRRPDGERPEAGRPVGVRAGEMPARHLERHLSTRSRARSSAPQAATSAGATRPAARHNRRGSASGSEASRPAPTADRNARLNERTPISAAGPLHTLLEGTFIDTVLTNRLDGSGTAPGQLPGHEPGVLPQRPARAHSCGGARSRRDATRSGARRDAARSGVSPAADARRQHAAPRSVSRPQSDRRCGPARQGQPALLVDVRSGRGGRAHQRPGAVDWHARAIRVARATGRSSSPVARTRHRRQAFR